VHLFYPGDPQHRERHGLDTSADVLALIPRLLTRHGQFDRIAVYAGPTFLFAVDGKGDRLP
jgi:hypothetical protein